MLNNEDVIDDYRLRRYFLEEGGGDGDADDPENNSLSSSLSE